jgi:hypothetical protein
MVSLSWFVVWVSLPRKLPTLAAAFGVEDWTPYGWWFGQMWGHPLLDL